MRVSACSRAPARRVGAAYGAPSRSSHLPRRNEARIAAMFFCVTPIDPPARANDRRKRAAMRAQPLLAQDLRDAVHDLAWPPFRVRVVAWPTCGARRSAVARGRPASVSPSGRPTREKRDGPASSPTILGFQPGSFCDIPLKIFTKRSRNTASDRRDRLRGTAESRCAAPQNAGTHEILRLAAARFVLAIENRTRQRQDPPCHSPRCSYGGLPGACPAPPECRAGHFRPPLMPLMPRGFRRCAGVRRGSRGSCCPGRYSRCSRRRPG